MRALEGGRDILHWVCVRGIQPHVCCVLARTILVARRLRVGRAEGRCLAAMVQTPSFLSRNRDRCCVICALRLYRNWVLIRMGKTRELNPYRLVFRCDEFTHQEKGTILM